jgi:hypothetical protein
MPFLQRLAIFLGLWLLAGVACAIFADVTFEGGDSEAVARLQLVFFTPLLAAIGMATAVVADHDPTWLNGVVWCIAIVTFVVHAIVTLTRRDRRQFIELVAVQMIIVVGSVSCVIGFFRQMAAVGW